MKALFRCMYHTSNFSGFWSQSYDFEIYNYNASVFSKETKICFASQAHQATRGAVYLYSAGVVTNDRRIGSWVLPSHLRPEASAGWALIATCHDSEKKHGLSHRFVSRYKESIVFQSYEPLKSCSGCWLFYSCNLHHSLDMLVCMNQLLRLWLASINHKSHP
jgi:hypothetical protein